MRGRDRVAVVISTKIGNLVPHLEIQWPGHVPCPLANTTLLSMAVYNNMHDWDNVKTQSFEMCRANYVTQLTKRHYVPIVDISVLYRVWYLWFTSVPAPTFDTARISLMRYRITYGKEFVFMGQPLLNRKEAGPQRSQIWGFSVYEFGS